jgi:predicted HAD superfamily Cof-like phosphohydrolase
MSNNMVKDIHDMHQKFGVHDWVVKQKNEQNFDALRSFLNFRLDFIDEEYKETLKAAYSEENPEEIVDGLIDIIVVALGTLDAFGVDAQKAWDQVHNANMAKEPGIKPERPNPLGLPDLMKPVGWTAPSHDGNHGYFTDIIQKHI